MKLYYSPLSPFARKVAIAAEILELTGSIEFVPGKGELMKRDPVFRALNPSGQIPTLITDDGEAIFDSPVICAYLNSLSARDIVGEGSERWRNWRDAAVGDSLADAALQYRYEVGLRPERLRWNDWREAWSNKIIDTLQYLEERSDALANRSDIGVISIFCALAFIDARIGELGWRQTHRGLCAWYEAFSLRPEVTASPA